MVQTPPFLTLIYPQKFAEAEKIKEKGNSSFRAGEFSEAKALYLDSLSKVGD